jgi:ligand-binding sensor domain-containing protein/signal transduction histidine kinase
VSARSCTRLAIRLFAVWYLSLIYCLSAQAAPVRTLNFDYLSVKDGLAQETVTTIVQDQQGFMWFGSQHGLSRFDGYRFTVYKTVPDDPRSLADNWVQALYVDKKNRLWVGTRGGLQRFDPASNNFTRFLADETGALVSAKRHVQSIIGDGYDQLWIATNDGLQHFDPETGRFVVMRHDAGRPGSLANDGVTALALDAGGYLWVGMKEGLDRLAQGETQFRHFRVDSAKIPNPALNEVQQLWVDQRQQLWIVTVDGIVTWQLGASNMTTHRFGPADGLDRGTITAFLQDRDSNLWLGTNTGGLHRWDPRTRRFVKYSSDPHGLAGNEVSALFQDQSGTLWVGTWTAGVKRVDLASGGFNRFYHVSGNPHTLSDSRIYGISADNQGHLLLATFGGIDQLDPATGEVRILRADPGMKHRLNSDEIVLSIYRDRQGKIWAGTSAGFGQFDLATGSFVARLFQSRDPNSDSITNINSDRDGVLWISTRGGLHRLDPATNREQTFRHDAQQPDSLSDDWVKMALEDQHGVLWVATDDGLNRLDRSTGKFTQFHHDAKNPDSLSNDRIQYLFQDKQGTLWIGTTGGLNKIESGPDGAMHFRSYTTKDGLAADSIGGILEDDEGNLWLSTATGISCFSPKSGLFKNYTSRDGMIEGYYYSGSAYRDADGTMYFGGANGLTAFRPEAIHDNPNPPPVVITDVQVLGKPLQGHGAAAPDLTTLDLTYDESMVALEFSALNYADPQRNRYRYQLLGFDKDWIDTDSTKRIATYTNLDPGHYIFRVAAANKDGVWNDAGASMSINITPPFWKTWWFRLVLALASFVALWIVDRARIRMHTEQKRRLENLVNARTREVVQQKQIVEQQKNEIEAAHRNLVALSDIGRNITASLDRGQIAASLHEHIARLMAADVFCVWQVASEQHLGQFSFAFEEGKLVRPIGEGVDEIGELARWCTTHRQPLLISDIEADGRMGFLPANQGVKPLSLLAAPIYINGEIAGVICVQSIARDAYQRVHLELLLGIAVYAGVALDNAATYSQLQTAQQKLQQYLADRERLFMSISHDLRSPITRLILRSELLEDDVLRDEFYEDLDDLEMMVKSALQSVKETNIHENVTEVRLDSLIKRILRGAELAGHKIAYSESGLTLFAKPLALKRAIGNLIDNALFYGKEVEVAVREVGRYIEIQVRDHGPGVPAEALKLLASAAVRLEHGRARNAGGLGLGLGIVRSIAEAHGGTLSLENHPAGGLVATIRLPAP